MRLFRSQRGSSLVELLVGGLIAMIALGAIIQIQITGYRNNQHDEERFLAQTEALLGLDRIAQDIRMSMGPESITAAGIVLKLSATRSITYTYNSATREVLREEDGIQRVVGTQVEQLAFYTEQDGRTLRVEWTARLSDGTSHVLISKASPRLLTGGSN